MELAADQLTRSHDDTSPFVRSGVAVCYQCSFTCNEGGSSCPECNFPLIIRSELSPPAGLRISDVLRRTSLRRGAPPLPGVHAAPRKAQLLMDARKRIRLAARQAAQTQADGQAQAATAQRSGTWGLIPISFVAVGFGIVAAVLQNVL